jgi:hypothetical protein
MLGSGVELVGLHGEVEIACQRDAREETLW